MVMAHRLIRSVRRIAYKTLSQQSHPSFLKKEEWVTRILNPLYAHRRSYISEMRKSAFEGNILRLLRNEIQYELERSPPTQQVQEYGYFKVDERPGEQWIRLRRNFGDKEEIKVEVTMFDHSVPIQKTSDITKGEDVQLHITMIVDIFKGENSDVMEFVCSAWPDSIEIQNVFTRRHDRITGQPYMGPRFKELDDELQNMLYDYLETRGITDELAAFLHKYTKYKDTAEFTRWMGNVKSFIEKK